MLCTICRHPQRTEIDALILAAEAKRVIARRFGIGWMSLIRHENNGHIPQHVVELVAATSRADLLQQVVEIRAATMEIINEADDPDVRLRAIARREKQIELDAKLLGLLKPGGDDFDNTAALQLERRKAFISEWIEKLMDKHQCDRLEAARLLYGMMQESPDALPLIAVEIVKAGGSIEQQPMIEIEAKQVDEPADDQNAVERAILPESRPSDDRSAIHQEAERRRVGAL